MAVIITPVKEEILKPLVEAVSEGMAETLKKVCLMLPLVEAVQQVLLEI